MGSHLWVDVDIDRKNRTHEQDFKIPSFNAKELGNDPFRKRIHPLSLLLRTHIDLSDDHAQVDSSAIREKCYSHSFLSLLLFTFHL